MLPAVLGHRKGGCGGRDGVSAGGYSHGWCAGGCGRQRQGGGGRYYWFRCISAIDVRGDSSWNCLTALNAPKKETAKVQMNM